MSEEEFADAESNADDISGKTTVIKQAAVHNASMIAAANKKAIKPSTPSEFAQISRAVIELEMMALKARLIVLDELAEMNDEEKMECLFQTLDKNRDGSLSVVEIADGLRRIHGDVNFEESIELAMQRVAYFDKDGDAKLQFEEFKEYATKLSEAFGASFHDLAEMLILSVVFSDSGNTEEDEFMALIADEQLTLALQEQEALTKVMEDERMKVLFHMFDLDADGAVDFVEVAMGLYKLKDDLDEAAGTAFAALLMFDDDHNTVLDYEEFTRFIVQLIKASGQTFDEAVFTMTKAAAEDNGMTKEELLKKIQESAAADADKTGTGSEIASETN